MSARMQMFMSLFVCSQQVEALRIGPVQTDNEEMRPVQTIGFNEEFDSCSSTLCGLPESFSAGSQVTEVFANYAQMHKQAREEFQRDGNLPTNAIVWRCAAGERERDGCGGIADMMRGMSFTLYVAILLQRPFFVAWNTLGIDMLDMFAPHLIDVHIPANMTADVLQPCQVLPYKSYMEKSILKSLQELPQGRCTIVKTNAVPEIFFNQSTSTFDTVSEQADRVKNSIDHAFLTGCAQRLMFQPSPTGFNSFSPESTSPYISVHMRFGDSAFGRQSIDEESKRIVRAALECAAQLGKEISPETAWNIHFASDLDAARTLAQEERSDVFLSDYQPSHIGHRAYTNETTNQELLGSAWGDFILLTRTRGIVTWGQSNYWSVARQLALLPSSRLRQAMGCKPMQMK